MSNLLENINNILEELENYPTYLTEKLSESQNKKLLTLAHEIDSNVDISSNDVQWDRFDSRWNTLILQAADSGNINSTKKTTYLKAVNVKDENGNPVTDDVYLQWDGSGTSKITSATLVSKDQASTIIDDRFLRNIVRGAKAALAKDSKTNKYTYTNIEKEEITPNSLNSKKDFKKGNAVTIDEAIQFYFNCIISTSTEYVIDFSTLRYWKKYITDSVIKNSSVTNSPQAQFILELLQKQVSFNEKRVLDILTKTLTEDENFALNLLIDTSSDIGDLERLSYMDLVSAIQKGSNFLVNAILCNCFDRINYKGILSSIQGYERFRTNISSGLNFKIDPKIITRVKASFPEAEDEAIATIIAKNLILLPGGELKKSPLLYPEEVKEISSFSKLQEFAEYKAADRSQRNVIFERIYISDDTGNYYLILGDKKYLLQENKGQLISKAKSIEFKQDTLVKVAFGTKEVVATEANLFNNLSDLTQCVFISKGDNSAADLFKLDGEELKVGEKSFSVVGNGGVSFTINSKNQVTRINLNEKITSLKGSDGEETEDSDAEEDEDSAGQEEKPSSKKNNEKDKTGKVLVSEEDAKIAVKNYFLKHKTKKLNTELKVNDFIDKVQPVQLETTKNAVIKELQKNPSLYGYNKDNKQIYGVDGKGNVEGSLLDILVTLLNGDVEEANAKAAEWKQKAAGSHRISKYITVNTKNLPTADMSSKTVADKIKQIASVLDGDPSKVTNKSDKATMNQIPKSDVAELISWFESRYDPKNQVVYDSAGNITKDSDTNKSPEKPKVSPRKVVRKPKNNV